MKLIKTASTILAVFFTIIAQEMFMKNFYDGGISWQLMTIVIIVIFLSFRYFMSTFLKTFIWGSDDVSEYEEFNKYDKNEINVHESPQPSKPMCIDPRIKICSPTNFNTYNCGYSPLDDLYNFENSHSED